MQLTIRKDQVVMGANPPTTIWSFLIYILHNIISSILF